MINLSAEIMQADIDRAGNFLDILLSGNLSWKLSYLHLKLYLFIYLFGAQSIHGPEAINTAEAGQLGKSLSRELVRR